MFRPDLTLPHSPQVRESVDSRIPENFAFGIQNPWLWTPEYSSRNTERNPESTVRKSECKTVLVYLTWGEQKLNGVFLTRLIRIFISVSLRQAYASYFITKKVTFNL